MLSVVILNYSRPTYIKDFIIPILTKYNIVDEIVISHGKKEAYFESTSPKVKNLKHYGKMNEEYGLTLRFVSAMEAKHDYVIIMDDDIVPNENSLQSLLDNMIKEERLYGIYGRMLNVDMSYNKDNVFGEVPIVLTRCLIASKSMCQYFLDNFRKYENINIKNSKPYWNGEDILFSLLSIKKYDKLPVAYDLKHYNTISNYLDFNNAISFGSQHDNYRKSLTKYFVKNLDLDEDVKKQKIESKKSQFRYFYENSVLLPFTVLFFVFIFVTIILVIKR